MTSYGLFRSLQPHLCPPIAPPRERLLTCGAAAAMACPAPSLWLRVTHGGRRMRKWLIHGLIYLLLAGGVAAAVVYALGTNPAAIRGLVQEQLTQRFRHVSVSVERARLRLLGGLLVRELRLARNDGLDRRDFLYAPTAVIYHD